MTEWNTLKESLLETPEVRAEHAALAPEYQLARQLIEARTAAGLSQVEVAERMGTKQSEVSRIEGGRQNISMAKLRRYASALGREVQVALV